MVVITPELLRKRAEHNEMILSTLEEVTLHQFKIRKIEALGTYCKRLKILYLQNNRITKIEGLNKLKSLEYLNLAINRIDVIENLERCESLSKLDLTANYIGDYRGVKCLQGLEFLSDLYLLGNPCCKVPHYRAYVISTLPQLKLLDGTEITRPERIVAAQTIASHGQYIDSLDFPSLDHPESDGSDYEDNDAAEKLRTAARQTKADDIDREAATQMKGKRDRPCASNDYRVLQFNDTEFEYLLSEEHATQCVVFEMALPVHLDTSHCEVEVHPTWIRVEVKHKPLQLRLPREVRTEGVTARRVGMTGILRVHMHVEEGQYIPPPVEPYTPQDEGEESGTESEGEGGHHDPESQSSGSDSDSDMSDLPQLVGRE
ncbi:hypothetical protein KIPB_001814 [Kipferlia bialata]|uniref:Dynein axonemal assembly factor 11-like CS domain-containing protein n=1 Tax=Kipferlia bialata TaxID=797122 RepID=A0A9K3CPH2_9EUKA|nr:hypothetical protein KIPB_001814 [Kipferlia bialata]|eukprot:g1814.t1